MNKLQIIREYWDAESHKDVSKIMSFFSDSIVINTLTDIIEGQKAVRQFYTKIINTYKESSIDIINCIIDGNQIAVEWKGRFLTKNDEMKLPRGCHVFRFSASKIGSIRAYFNPADF